MTKTYDSYKDSGIAWIGNIPSGWEVAHIKHYCRQIYAGGPPQSNNPEYWDGDIPWIPSGVCHDNIIKNAPKYITKLGLENSSTKLIPQNTSVIAMTGATCGNTGYVTFETCMNQSVTAYVAKETNTYSKYIFYLLQAAREYILTKRTGGAQSGINVDDCKNLKVPFIKYTEQQAIASYLDEKCGEIDSLIFLQEEMISELQVYKQSIITKAVTKGLDSNVQMKDSGVECIGDIPEQWTCNRFKAIANVKANLVHPDDYLDMPQIAPDCIEKNSGKLIKIQTVQEANVISDNHFFYKGQILYSKIRPTLNKVTIAPYDGLCCADMYPIETKLYLKYALFQMLSSTFNNQVAVVVQDRVKMPKINKEELDQILMVVPPFAEQQAIASYLDEKTSQIDSLIALKQEKITELKDYKKSIIYEYVTGKKKV